MQFIHASKFIDWSFPLLFSQSIMTLKSPMRWRYSIFNLVARCSVAQAPRIYALVLVPGLQLKVHL
jgi:hypothetical protein